jgi:flagellar assembly protein FliH
MAAQILADAQAEAKALTDGAAERGYEAGFAKGLDEGREQGAQTAAEQAAEEARGQYAALQGEWVDALQRVEAEREALVRDGSDTVLRVAVRLAERLTHRAVQLDEQVVVRQVDAALAHVLRPATLTVTAHPDDLAILERAMPELGTRFEALRHATLRPDDAIQRGGCLITHGQGAIDATLTTQLQRIVEQALPDALAEATPETGSVPEPAPEAESIDPAE